MLATPAGATAGCSAGEFPATFAAESGLKVDCNTDAGQNVQTLTIHDATNANWHHGAARIVTLGSGTASTTAANAAASTTIRFLTGVITSADINRPISAGSTLPGGLFIKGPVTTTTAIVSQPIPLAHQTIANVKIDYTTNRNINDAFCTAVVTSNAIAPFSTTVSAETTTVTAPSSTSTYTAINTAHVLHVASNVNFQQGGGILNVPDTTGAAHAVTYTGVSGTTEFTGVTVAASTAKPKTTANAITWTSTKLSQIGKTGVASVAGIPNGPGTVTVTTSLTTATLSITGTQATPAALVGVAFVSGPVTTATISPGKAVTWVSSSLSSLTGATLTVNTASALTNGFTAANNAGFTSPATIETSAGVGAGSFTYGSAGPTTFTGVTGTGSGTIAPGYRVTDGGGANTTLTSASANFEAGDVGKSISAGPFGDGTWITNRLSATQVTLSAAPLDDCTTNSGGNPNSPHPVQPLTGKDILDIGSTTISNPNSSPNAPEMFNGSDAMNMELSNTVNGGAGFTCSGSTLTLTAGSISDTGGFTGTEKGLAVTVKSVTGVLSTAGTVVSTVTAPASIVMSHPCPLGGVTAAAGPPVLSASAYIGVPDANAPVNNAAVMTLAAEINLNPALVATQDDCSPGGNTANDTFEGFEVVGGWLAPGATYVSSTSAPPVSVAEIVFPTSVLSFNGYVVPKAGGDAVVSEAHYNFDFAVLPTSLAVCITDTPANGGVPVDGTQLAFGINATTMSTSPFLPTGSGNPADPGVRSLLPVTSANSTAEGFGGPFVQKIELPSIPGSPFTGPACTIDAPTVLPAISPTTCGDG